MGDSGHDKSLASKGRFGNLRECDGSDPCLADLRLNWHSAGDAAEVVTRELERDFGGALIEIERLVSVSVGMFEEVSCADQRTHQRLDAYASVIR